MAETTPEILKTISESAGGVFRFGQGIMGKSAIALALLMAAVVMAVWKPSPIGIVALALGAIIFFCWFYPLLNFAKKHPAEAFLEGALWTAWKRFEYGTEQRSLTAEEVRALKPVESKKAAE